MKKILLSIPFLLSIVLLFGCAKSLNFKKLEDKFSKGNCITIVYDNNHVGNLLSYGKYNSVISFSDKDLENSEKFESSIKTIVEGTSLIFPSIKDKDIIIVAYCKEDDINNIIKISSQIDKIANALQKNNIKNVYKYIGEFKNK